jgi:hypothetical protein
MAVAFFAFALLLACGRDEPPRRASRGEPPPAPPPVAPEHVFAPTAGPEVDPGRRPTGPVARVDEVAEDTPFASRERIVARRLVYRTQLHVPAGLGQGESNIAQPAAELRVDVAEDRLRAYFVGNGWPVARGAEVRLRRDRPGVYVFDEAGGRPLGPGRMAEWFQGGPVGEYQPPLGVRAPPPHEEPTGPGDLVCALLAEWIGAPREDVMRRCQAGPPFRFRLGPYRAERTADLPLELAKSALRADHADPPDEWPTSEPSALFFETSVLERLGARALASPPPRADPSPTSIASAEGFTVLNEGSTRVLVAVDGLGVGVVSPGHALRLPGLSRLPHAIGALRPLGAPVLRGRQLRPPATITVRR